jgi:altronate hydrolase
MLTRSSLTIRLHPNDDVAIAAGRSSSAAPSCSTRNVTVVGSRAAGHKVATRAIARGQPVKRYNQVIGFASRDIAPGEHVHLHNLAMGAFERDYAFGADARPVDFVEVPATVRGRRSRGRARRHAQLHRHPVDRELLGHRCARHRRSLSRASARAWPNVDGVVALTHGSGCGMDTQGEGMKLLRRTLGGYASTPTSPAC